MAGLVPAIHVFLAAVQNQDMDARHEAGHDAEDAGERAHLNARFSDSLCQTAAKRHHPYSLIEAPGRPVVLLFFSPLANSEGDGAPSGAAFVCQCPRSLSGSRERLSARHPDKARAVWAYFAGVFLTAPGALFVDQRTLPAIRQPAPGRRLLLAAGRSPGAARVRAVRQHTRGRRIRLHHQTPLDDAPR